MKKSELKQIIKEEIQKILNEASKKEKSEYEQEALDRFGKTLPEKIIRNLFREHGSDYEEYLNDPKYKGSNKTKDVFKFLGY